MKRFSKAVEKSNNPQTGFKTQNQMRQSMFSSGKINMKPTFQKFNSQVFKTQHKG